MLKLLCRSLNIIPQRSDHPLAVVSRAQTESVFFSKIQKVFRVPERSSCSSTDGNGYVYVRVRTALHPPGSGEAVQVTVVLGTFASQTVQLSAGSWLRPAGVKKWTLRLDALVEDAAARASSSLADDGKPFIIVLKIVMGDAAASDERFSRGKFFRNLSISQPESCAADHLSLPVRRRRFDRRRRQRRGLQLIGSRAEIS